MFHKTIISLATAAAIALATTAPAKADDYNDARDIVTGAETTLNKVLRAEETGDRVRRLLKRAKGVMIYPQVLKGALFIGGEGGTGALMSRQANDAWSYPAFYTMGSVSFGLQVGGEASQTVLLIMTQRGFDAIMDDQVKVGADISAAAGPKGVGAEASTTTAAGADIYVYSINQGLFVGASLEGAVIAKRSDLNEAYYKQSVTPRQIVRDNAVQNAEADALRGVLEAND